MAIRRIEGLLHLASEGRYAILVGRFNSFVVEHLLEGAIDTLKRHGVSEDNITVAYAPGAWELPIVAKNWLILTNLMPLLLWAQSFVEVLHISTSLQANVPKALVWLHLKVVFRLSMVY